MGQKKEKDTCPTCNGTGGHWRTGGRMDHWVTCDTCGGSGEVDNG